MRHTAMGLWAIATNTLRESIRNRIFATLLACAVVLFAAALLLGQMSLHQEARVTKDVVVAASTVFVAMITIYATVSMLQREMERRTLYTILSKPIGRWQFLVGKYLGTLMLVATTLGALLLTGHGLLWLQDVAAGATLYWAFWGIFLQMAIVCAIALLMATFSSPLLSGFVSAGLFIAGSLASQLSAMVAMLRRMGNPAAGLLERVQYLLPNLEALNLSYEVTHDVPIPMEYVAASTAYTAMYAGICLGLAAWVFARRDFL